MSGVDDTAAAAAAAAEKLKVKKAKEKEKQEKIQKWIDGTTLDDAVVDDSSKIQVGREPNQTTTLVSIKGADIKSLSVSHLRKFCVQHRIGGYKDKTKLETCQIIVAAVKAKNLDSDMYPEDFGDKVATDDTEATGWHRRRKPQRS